MKSRNRLESFSKDPIGFAAGDANLYRYVGNQPTTKTDPSGLEQVEIEVITFIPFDWVPGPGGLFELEGDDRDVRQTPDGSYRMKSKVVVELDPNVCEKPIVSSEGKVGESAIRFYYLPGVLRRFEGEYRDEGTQTLTPTGTRDGGRTIVRVRQSGTVPRSFIVTAPAPAIDYNFTFAFDANGQCRVSGTHDGFPAYEVFINGKLRYSYDPRDTNERPESLFPPMEHDIDNETVEGTPKPPWYQPYLPYPFNRGFPF
jgi:hypothetical protein